MLRKKKTSKQTSELLLSEGIDQDSYSRTECLNKYSSHRSKTPYRKGQHGHALLRL
jgi:hypothetical protein